MKLLFAAALISLSACTSPPRGNTPWTLGAWRGERIDAASGHRAPMTMTVQPILGGAATLEQLEVRGGKSVYRGASMTAFDSEQSRWVKQYVNSVKGRFVRIEGARGSDDLAEVWDVASNNRQAHLTSKLTADGTWVRIMRVAANGSSEWGELWRDVLVRQ